MKKIFLYCFSILIFLACTSTQAQDNSRFNWFEYGKYDRGRSFSLEYNNKNHNLYSITSCVNWNNYDHSIFLFNSPDSGKTWIPKYLFSKGFDLYEIVSLKIDDDGIIYLLSDFGRGILRSINDGVTFEYIPISKDSNICVELFFDSKGIIYGLSDKCIFKSIDKGNTWITIPTGFRVKNMIIDSKDDIYLLSLPRNICKDSSIKSSGYPYPIHISNLISSENELYKFDKNLYTFVLMQKSKNDSIPTNIFIDLADNGYGITLAQATSYYLNYDDMSETSIYKDLKIKVFDNRDSLIDILDFSNLSQFETNIFNVQFKNYMAYNNNGKLILYWNDLLLIDSNIIEHLGLRLDNNYTGELVRIDKAKGTSFLNIIADEQYTAFSFDDAYTWEEPYFNFQTNYPFKLIFQKRDSTIIVNDSCNRVHASFKKTYIWTSISANLDIKNTISSIGETKLGNLIVGTKNNGIYYLNNSSWEQRNKGLDVGLKSLSITQIIDLKDSSLLIGTENGLFSTNDECMSYKQIFNASCKEILPVGNNIFIVTNDGKLYFLTCENGVVIQSQQMLSEYFVTTIASNSSACLIAGTHSNGVLKSTDNGKNWSLSNNELYSPIIYKIISTNNDEFIVFAQTGIFYTKYDGVIWERNNYDEIYNSKKIVINLNESFKLTKLRYGKIFKINPEDCMLLTSISDSFIVDRTGWIKDPISLIGKSKFSNGYGTKKFSNDGKYLIELCESGDYNDYSFYNKYDYDSGKLQENWPIKYYGRAKNIVDFNENGQISILNLNDEYKRDSIFIFQVDIINDKTFDTIVFYPKDKNKYTLVKYVASNTNRKCFLFTITDTSKKSYSEFIVVENNKVILRKIINSFTPLKHEISKDCNLIVYADSYTSLKLLNIDKNLTYDINMSDFNMSTVNLPDPKISSDNRWLYFCFIGFTDIHDSYFFDLNELGKEIKLKYKNKIRLNYINSAFNLYIGNSDFIFPVYDDDNGYGGIITNYIKYNADENKIKAKSLISSNGYYYELNLLAPDKKSFVIGNQTVRKFIISELLNVTLLDFSASKTICQVKDTVQFTADIDPNIDYYSWDFGDESFGTKPSTYHIYRKPGRYTVKLVYYYNNRQDTTVKTNYIEVKAQTDAPDIDPSTTNELSVYPNPANNFIDIHISSVPDPTLAGDIYIYNSIGKIIFTKSLPNLDSHRIDISALPNGIYFCTYSVGYNIHVKSFMVIR